jgi:hypothetical protein
LSKSICCFASFCCGSDEFSEPCDPVVPPDEQAAERKSRELIADLLEVLLDPELHDLRRCRTVPRCE